jgi:hypothetical protein
MNDTGELRFSDVYKGIKSPIVPTYEEVNVDTRDRENLLLDKKYIDEKNVTRNVTVVDKNKIVIGILSVTAIIFLLGLSG